MSVFLHNKKYQICILKLYEKYTFPSVFTSSPSIKSTNQHILNVSHVLPFESTFPLWGQSVIFCILLILNLVPKLSCSNKLASFRSEH